MEGEEETLDKKMRYHKRCYHMGRSTRTHIPLIELDGRSTGMRFTCRICRRDIDDEWFPGIMCKRCYSNIGCV